VTFVGGLADRGVAAASDGALRWAFRLEDKDFVITYEREAYAPSRDATTERAGAPDDHPEEVAGVYACTSGCQTTNELHLEADGSWWWASDVGTWRADADQVVFSSPYGGGSGWASGGPVDWGPNEFAAGTITWSDAETGAKIVWTKG
jgi:hypothetical protein